MSLDEHNGAESTETPVEPHHQTQYERDAEIARIQQHCRESHPRIERPPQQPAAPPRKALLLIGAALLVLLAAGALTLLLRASHDRALASETNVEAMPTVVAVHPLAEQPDLELVLPGTLQAFQESPIFARTNGYLLRWYKDIGSRVKRGDLLAEIDTPEIDQELRQARASREQVVSQVELARVTAERWENLRKSDSVSAQEADQQSSAYRQSQANLAASNANVRRLEDLESFKRVYAPFNGVLTRRNVDAGALINAGAGGKELFDIAQVELLRVYTSVPQAYSPYIRPGVKVTITLQEFPGKKFGGSVARTAEAIDPATRTLLTEVDVPNRSGELLPGSFGQVHFTVGANVQRLTVPVNAMLFRSQGPQVAVVNTNSRIELRSLTIGRDYGTALEVLGGLSAGDQVVVNPPDSLEQGQQVRVVQPSEGEAQQNQAGTGQGPASAQPQGRDTSGGGPRGGEPQGGGRWGGGEQGRTNQLQQTPQPNRGAPNESQQNKIGQGETGR
jgi:membrane fusion protein, multidrug efflux system